MFYGGGGVNAQVGIGTTSPSNDLDVEGSGAAATAIDINNTDTGDPKINLQLNGTTTFSMGIDNSDADKLKIGTSALETNTRLTINSSGYVGIGTSTPIGPLEVYSTTQNAKGISLSDGTSWISLVENLASGAYSSLSSNGDMGLIFSTDNNNAAAAANGLVIGPHSSGENGIKIMEDGKVGIGIASPTSLLHVNGSTNLDGTTVVNETGAAVNFRVESDANANMLFVDGTNNKIGINTASPVGLIDIYSPTAAAQALRVNDGTSWLSLVPTLGSDQYNFLTEDGDMALFFSTDNNAASDVANGLVIGPHSSGESGIKIMENGKVGIGMTPSTNLLEVNGTASKTAAGDWLANSDARLKKDIKQMDSKAVLDKMLALKGITYYWNDTVTGSKRPTQLQYGFTAQNIKEVFPILVEEDNLGYLQTAYGTYDAMYVESMRALQQQIDAQQAIIEAQKKSNDAQKAEIETLKAQANAQKAETTQKLTDLENKMNAMLLLLNNKQDLTVKQ